MRVRFFLGALLGLGLGGCGESGAGPTASGGGGQSTQAGMGGQGGSKATGGSAGSGGNATAGASGGGGMAPVVELPPQPECATAQGACEGQCLNVGDAMNDCQYMVQTYATVSRMHAQEGYLYFAGSLWADLGEDTPHGLLRFERETFARTDLDTTAYATDVVALEIAGETIFYLIYLGGFRSEVRSVPLAGGTPTVLVPELGDANSLLVRGDRVYIANTFPGDGEFERARWLPATGGTLTDTDVTSVHRLRANTTQLVGSWNGDIELAPLPDGTPATELLDDFGLPDHERWWVDDEYVYWLNDEGEYRRLSLSAMNASAEQGEVVQTLPAGIGVLAEGPGELLLALREGTATGLFTMPLVGGPLTQVGVIGETGFTTPAAFDEKYVYVVQRSALLRLNR